MYVTCNVLFIFFFFFFKQKTAYEMRISDWSSDVCSSDLYAANERQHNRYANKAGHQQQRRSDQHGQAPECKLDRLSDADTGTQSKRIKRERAQHRHQEDRKSVV